MSRPITFLFLVCFATFAVLHNLALSFSLYWYYWWFDIVMHFFGGVFISLGLYVLAELSVVRRSFLKPIVFTITALVVMVLWEVFELAAGIPIIDGFYLDTSADIVFGGVGAVVGYQLGKKFNEQLIADV